MLQEHNQQLVSQQQFLPGFGEVFGFCVDFGAVSFITAITTFFAVLSAEDLDQICDFHLPPPMYIHNCLIPSYEQRLHRQVRHGRRLSLPSLGAFLHGNGRQVPRIVDRRNVGAEWPHGWSATQRAGQGLKGVSSAVLFLKGTEGD